MEPFFASACFATCAKWRCCQSLLTFLSNDTTSKRIKGLQTDWAFLLPHYTSRLVRIGRVLRWRVDSPIFRPFVQSSRFVPPSFWLGDLSCKSLYVTWGMCVALWLVTKTLGGNPDILPWEWKHYVTPCDGISMSKLPSLSLSPIKDSCLLLCSQLRKLEIFTYYKSQINLLYCYCNTIIVNWYLQ